MTSAHGLKRGNEIELVIDKFGDRGQCIGRLDGKVVFVPRVLPGERVRARVVRDRSRFLQSEPLAILNPSPDRVTPKCRYFGTCGGCVLQHVSYEAQLESKHKSVCSAMAHHGGLQELEVRPPIAAPTPYFYRNKMEFSFAARRWLTPEEIASGDDFDTTFALGLHPPGNYSKVLDLYECHLQSERSAALVNGVRTFAREAGWHPWNARTHEGFLRHLVVRESAHETSVMVNLVTFGHDTDRMRVLAEFIQAEYPHVTTLVNTINTSRAQTAFGERTVTVFGPGCICDRIGPLLFEIGPNDFFQTNTRQSEALVDVVRNLASVQAGDHVYDLYCGTGTIALSLAGQAARVTGVELVKSAVANARANAERNGITNCTFVSGDMLEVFTAEFVDANGPCNVLIVDPPRAGLHPKVATRIAALGARRVVYVSCNALSQARDLKLMAKNYRPVVAQPVDLFPQTAHIENIVLLERLSER